MDVVSCKFNVRSRLMCLILTGYQWPVMILFTILTSSIRNARIILLLLKIVGIPLLQATMAEWSTVGAGDGSLALSQLLELGGADAGNTVKAEAAGGLDLMFRSHNLGTSHGISSLVWVLGHHTSTRSLHLSDAVATGVVAVLSSVGNSGGHYFECCDKI